ncbi:MAG: 16S rRNA methyltransferase [Treponema sp.]|jgi:16S rRNA (cytosine1407-C5)-methyltransferase|nr:16S rRNA methyltransferase [Treponema sp.]
MGKDEFDSYYKNIYGSRWNVLKEALLESSTPIPYSDGLAVPYMMDEASVIAAKTLRLPEEGLILDACAAPGGKTLVIASRMNDEVSLLSNEFSSERRRRLVNVLDEYLPEEKRSRVQVSGFDAAAQGGRKSEYERFSAIMLDVPCSSERHVLGSEKALAEWTEARPKFLSGRQWSLLSSAFLLLKPGAALVYSTCSISPLENDFVTGRLIKKYKDAVCIDKPDFSAGEETQFGRMILPDHDKNLGPMYVARFIKREV